jgi:hypothetical protein
VSLTSHIKDPYSPVRQFFQEQFPNVRTVADEHRFTMEKLPATKGMPYDTLGMALTHRLYYYFAVTNEQINIAKDAAQRFSSPTARPGRLPHRLVNDYFGELDCVLQQLQPAQRRLPRAQEEHLLRHCVALALCERLHRDGPDGSPLLEPEPKKTVEELLAFAQPAWLDDLCAQSWSFYEQCAELLREPVKLNPLFEGSGDVGGADGDLILGDCLIEIKSTLDPIRLDRWRERLYQLVGYCLLDYQNEHQLQEVGIYMARQRRLIRWPLDELLQTLAGGPVPPLPELRARFRAVAATLGDYARYAGLSPEERVSYDQARRVGYLVMQDESISLDLISGYWAWCRENRQPLIWVRMLGAKATIEVTADPQEPLDPDAMRALLTQEGIPGTRCQVYQRQCVIRHVQANQVERLAGALFALIHGPREATGSVAPAPGPDPIPAPPVADLSPPHQARRRRPR